MADVQVKTTLTADVRPYVTAMHQASEATKGAEAAIKRTGAAATEAGKAQSSAGKAAEDAAAKAAEAAAESARQADRSAIRWAAVGTAITVAGIKATGMLMGAIDAASGLNESASKMKFVFGESASQIEAWSKTVGGMSTKSVYDAASMMALFGKSAGLTGDKLADFSKQMVELSVDLGSFFDSSPEDAMQAIGSALRGESESIRRYNVLLDDMTLRQRGVKLGIIATTQDALTPQQKVLAAHAEILAQTSAAQGDYTRTASSLANVTRDLAADTQNAKAALGEALLPVMAKLYKAGGSLMQVFSGLPEPLQATTAYSMALLAAIALLGPSLTALAGAAKGAAGALAVFRASAIVTNLATAGLSGSIMALRLTMLALTPATLALIGAMGAFAGIAALGFGAVWVAQRQTADRVDTLTEKLKEATTAGRDLNDVLRNAKIGLPDEEITKVEDLIKLIKDLKAAEAEETGPTQVRGGGGRVPRRSTYEQTHGAQDMREQLAGIDAWLASIDSAKAASFFNDLAAAAERLGIPLEELVSLLPNYSSTLSGATDAAGKLEAAQGILAEQSREAADALAEATAAAYDNLNATLALSGAKDDLLGAEDRLRASIQGPASSVAASSAASKAQTEATNKEIAAIRKKDQAEEEAEIKRARRRAQKKADARADREAQEDARKGHAAFIEADKKLKRGEDLTEEDKAALKGEPIGEREGSLTKAEQKKLDKEIEGIRTKHKKAVDARVKGMKDEAKAGSGAAKVYKDVSKSLDNSTAGGLRNRATLRAEIKKNIDISKQEEQAALDGGATQEEASKVGYKALQRLREGLEDDAAAAGFAREDVKAFFDEVDFSEKDITIKFKIVVDMIEAEEAWGRLMKMWGPGKGKEYNHNLGAWLPAGPPPKNPLPAPKNPSPDKDKDKNKRPARGSGGAWATGGEIHGPGGPRSDSIPIWASAGEYVVNASSYSANRDLVRAINSSNGRVAGGMNVGSVTVNEYSPNRVRASVIDALAESAYRSGAVR